MNTIEYSTCDGCGEEGFLVRDARLGYAEVGGDEAEVIYFETPIVRVDCPRTLYPSGYTCHGKVDFLGQGRSLDPEDHSDRILIQVLQDAQPIALEAP